MLTGCGANLIIIDDPLKPKEALSQTQRRAANEWFDHTLYIGGRRAAERAASVACNAGSLTPVDAGSHVVLQFLLLLLSALFVFGLLLPLVRRPRLLLAH